MRRFGAWGGPAGWICGVLALGGPTYAQEAGPLKLGGVKVGGLLQGWYINDQKAGAKDEFRARRAEIKLSGQAHRLVSWTIMFDPAKPLNIITPAQGGAQEVDPKTLIFKDFFITFSGEDLLAGSSFQIGQFKPPFGMEGTQSSAQLETVERAAQSSVLGWSDYREPGALIELKMDSWQASVGVFNGEGPNTGDENEVKDIAGRITWKPIPSLHLGVSGYRGKGKAQEFLNERWGLEASWTPGPWSFRGEAAQGHGATSLGSGPGRATAYGQAGYFFTPKLQGVARLDWWEPDTQQALDIQNEFTAGLNYLINGHKAKLQANYVRHEEEGPSVPNDLVRVAFQVSF